MGCHSCRHCCQLTRPYMLYGYLAYAHVVMHYSWLNHSTTHDSTRLQVHLFGSAANGLSICHNNDIDVCLEMPGLPDAHDAKCE